MNKLDKKNKSLRFEDAVEDYLFEHYDRMDEDAPAYKTRKEKAKEISILAGKMAEEAVGEDFDIEERQAQFRGLSVDFIVGQNHEKEEIRQRLEDIFGKEGGNE